MLTTRQVIGAWLHTRAAQAGGRLVIAADGKAVRGARNREEKAPHLVAALAHGIGEVAVDAKSNENRGQLRRPGQSNGSRRYGPTPAASSPRGYRSLDTRRASVVRGQGSL
jgi:hypothetical protein